MRKVLYGLVFVVVALVGAALIGPSAVDWNDFKAEIAQAVEDETGRKLAIGGDLDLRLLPMPRFEASDVRLASIEGATFPDLVRLKAIRARVRLIPLLSGRIEVESLALIEPVIELERLEDGRVTWAFGAAAGRPVARAPATGRSSFLPPPAPKTEEPEIPDPSEAMPEGFRLDKLTIEDGTVVYRTPEGIRRVEGLTTDLAATTLKGPYKAKGRVRIHDLPLSFEAAIGSIRADAPTAVFITAGLIGTETTLEIKGALHDPTRAPRLDVKLALEGQDLAATASRVARVTRDRNEIYPAALARPFSVRGALQADAARAALDDLDAALGTASARGAVRVGFGERPALQARLRLAPFDLDKWLAATPDRLASRPGAPSGAGASGGESEPFALPADLTASVELGAEGILYRGRRIHEIRLAAALNDGELTLSQVSMRLPGGAEASAFGFLAAREGVAAYDGTIDGRADDLRGLLAWLGMELPAISPDRLRKLQFSGKFRGNGREVQVTDVKVRLDASRMTGGVTLALRDRPAFGARFNVEQVTVDAYLPSDRPASSAEAAAARDADAVLADEAATAGTPARWPFAVLQDFDANLAVRVGTLAWRRTAVQGIAFDGTLLNGTLEVRQADVRSIAGTSFGLAGTFRGFHAIPSFSGTVTARSGNVGGFMRLAGIGEASAGAALGRFALDAKAEASAEAVDLEGTLRLAGGEVRLDGKATALAATPRIDLRLDGAHPELVRLARLAGVRAADPATRVGPVRLSTRIQGGLESIALDGRLVAAGTTLSLDGAIAHPLGGAKIHGKVAITHPELAKLHRLLDSGYRPARPSLGPVKIEAKLSGDAESMRFEGIDAKIGPSELRGEASLAFAATRPKLVATLEAGTIPVDAFLTQSGRRRVSASPAAVAAPAAAGSGKGGQWDRTPIDLSGLGALDAEVRLTAEAISLDDFRLEEALLVATLADRTLTVERLDGALFGGRLAMAGTLADARSKRDKPRLSGTLKIENANVGAALLQTAGFDIAGGTLGAEAELAATGRSQDEFVRSLSGKGRFAVSDGALKGFDLSAVGAKLANPGRGTDVIAALGEAMSGGTTAFDRLDGSFTAKHGVFETTDTTITGDAGNGEAEGKIDLGHWTIDMRTKFRLAKPKGAPAFDLALTGPLDDPERRFGADSIKGFFLQSEIGGLVERIAPAKPPAKAEKAKVDAPAAKKAKPTARNGAPDPEDILRGLLNGLRR